MTLSEPQIRAIRYLAMLTAEEWADTYAFAASVATPSSLEARGLAESRSIDRGRTWEWRLTTKGSDVYRRLLSPEAP